jgi:hypothetical protein
VLLFGNVDVERVDVRSIHEFAERVRIAVVMGGLGSSRPIEGKYTLRILSNYI